MKIKTSTMMLFILGVLTSFLLATEAVAQSANDTAKVKKAVTKIGVKGDITIIRTDGQWFYGSVEQIDDVSFTIYEIEQKTRINFSYAQVSKVFKGYGEGAALRRDRNGHRIPPSRRHLVRIIA